MLKALFKINKVIKYLVIADTINYAALGMITPIIAVYYSDHITDGSLAVAGIAASIYFVISGVFQIPLGLFMDRFKGEFDDYWFMVGGSLITSLTYFLYLFATLSWHIYIIQAISAIGYSILYPAWTAIFSRHLDKEKEGFEWSVYNTFTSFASALTAGIGAYIAENFGFQPLFVIIGFVTLFSNLFLLLIFDKFIKKEKKTLLPS